MEAGVLGRIVPDVVTRGAESGAVFNSGKDRFATAAAECVRDSGARARETGSANAKSAPGALNSSGSESVGIAPF